MRPHATNLRVYIGQGVQLEAQVIPSDLLSGSTPAGTFSWTILGTENGTAIRTYTIFDNQSVGVVMYLTSLNGLQSQSPHFYWVSGGSKSVVCSIHVAGLICTPSTTFTAVRPSGDLVQTRRGNIGVGPYLAPLSTNHSDYLHDGNPSSKAYPSDQGIRWTVTLPADHGYCMWTQLVLDRKVTIMNSKGEKWIFGAIPFPALDTKTPYGGGLAMYPDGSTGQEDSPGIQIHPFNGSGEANDYAVSVQNSDSFKDWLMYKPDHDPAGVEITDAIFVPLGSTTWGWLGSLAGGNVDVGDVHHFDAARTGGSFSGTPYISDSTFPTWKYIAHGRDLSPINCTICDVSIDPKGRILRCRKTSLPTRKSSPSCSRPKRATAQSPRSAVSTTFRRTLSIAGVPASAA